MMLLRPAHYCNVSSPIALRSMLHEHSLSLCWWSVFLPPCLIATLSTPQLVKYVLTCQKEAKQRHLLCVETGHDLQATPANSSHGVPVQAALAGFTCWINFILLTAPVSWKFFDMRWETRLHSSSWNVSIEVNKQAMSHYRKRRSWVYISRGKF